MPAETTAIPLISSSSFVRGLLLGTDSGFDSRALHILDIVFPRRFRNDQATRAYNRCCAEPNEHRPRRKPRVADHSVGRSQGEHSCGSHVPNYLRLSTYAINAFKSSGGRSIRG